jgi:hypothetical protein
MPDNSLRSTRIAYKPIRHVCSVAAPSPREVEDARIVFITRRLRVSPHLAAVVAHVAFGEVRS